MQPGTYLRTSEHRAKMSNSLKESSVFQAAVSSVEYREKKRKESLLRGCEPPHLTGDKSSNWKGGVSLLKDSLQTSFRYRQWRSDVFQRDNYTCQKCGKNKCYFEAHHLKTKKSIFLKYKITTLQEALKCEELFNINNGVTLCFDCHRNIHRRS